MDTLFKEALQIYEDDLISTYSVVTKENITIRYKDLIKSFGNVSKGSIL